jgi:hypothetical protein
MLCDHQPVSVEVIEDGQALLLEFGGGYPLHDLNIRLDTKYVQSPQNRVRWPEPCPTTGTGFGEGAREAHGVGGA